jgi:hypothetical protein
MPEPPPAALPATEQKGFKLGFVITFAVALILIVAGFFTAWFTFFASNPPPQSQMASTLVKKPEIAAKQFIREVGTPRPADPIQAPLAQPAPSSPTTPPPAATSLRTPIDRTQAFVAARRESAQVRVDTLENGADAPAQGTSTLPVPAPQATPAQAAPQEQPSQAPVTPPAVAVPATQSPAPSAQPTPAPEASEPDVSVALRPEQPTVQPATPGLAPALSMREVAKETPPAPKASSSFKRFVADATIKGVFQGTPPRILINGRTLHAGEIADKSLGISFDSINPENRTIIFKDAAGATVTRKY